MKRGGSPQHTGPATGEGRHPHADRIEADRLAAGQTPEAAHRAGAFGRPRPHTTIVLASVPGRTPLIRSRGAFAGTRHPQPWTPVGAGVHGQEVGFVDGMGQPKGLSAKRWAEAGALAGSTGAIGVVLGAGADTCCCFTPGGRKQGVFTEKTSWLGGI